MVGSGSTDPNDANPTRVADGSQVERVELREFEVGAGEIPIQVRDAAGVFALLTSV